MNSASVLNPQSALRTPQSTTADFAAVEEHAHLIVGLLPRGLVWCMKRGEQILNQGEAASFAEIRGIQVRAGIWDVTCAGLNRPDLHEAAWQYNWEMQKQ